MKKLLSIMLSTLMIICMTPAFVLTAWAEIIDENMPTQYSTDVKGSGLDASLLGSGNVEITSDAKDFNDSHINLYADGSDEYTFKVASPQQGTTYKWTLYKWVDDERVKISDTGEFSADNTEYTMTQEVISSIYEEAGEYVETHLQLEAKEAEQETPDEDWIFLGIDEPSTSFSFEWSSTPGVGLVYEKSMQACRVNNADFRDGGEVDVSCVKPVVEADPNGCVSIRDADDYIIDTVAPGDAVLKCGYSYQLGSEQVNRTVYKRIHVTNTLVTASLNTQDLKCHYLPGDTVVLVPEVEIQEYDEDTGTSKNYKYSGDMGGYKVKSIKLVEEENWVAGGSGEAICSTPSTFRENGIKKWRTSINVVKDEHNVCMEGYAQYDLVVVVETPDGEELEVNSGLASIDVTNDFYEVRFKNCDNKIVYPGESFGLDALEVVHIFRDESKTGSAALAEETLDSSAVNFSNWVNLNEYRFTLDEETNVINVKNKVSDTYPTEEYVRVKGSYTDCSKEHNVRDIDETIRLTVNGYNLDFESESAKFDEYDNMLVTAILDDSSLTPDNDEINVKTSLDGAKDLKYKIKYTVLESGRNGYFDYQGNIKEENIIKIIEGNRDGSLVIDQAGLKEIADELGGNNYAAVVATAVEVDSDNEETGRVLGSGTFDMCINEQDCGILNDCRMLPTEGMWIDFTGDSYFTNVNHKDGANLNYTIIDAELKVTEGNENAFSLAKDEDFKCYRINANVKDNGEAYAPNTAELTVSYVLEGEPKIRTQKCKLQYVQDYYSVYLNGDTWELLNGQTASFKADVSYWYYDNESKDVCYKEYGKNLNDVRLELVEEADGTEDDVLTVVQRTGTPGTWDITANATPVIDEFYNEGFNNDENNIKLCVFNNEQELLAESNTDTIYIVKKVIELFYKGSTPSSIDVYEAEGDARSFALADFQFKSATEVLQGEPVWVDVDPEDVGELSFENFNKDVWSLNDDGTVITLKEFDAELAANTYLPDEYQGFSIISDSWEYGGWYEVELKDSLVNLYQCIVEANVAGGKSISLADLSSSFTVYDSEKKVVDPTKYQLLFSKKGAFGDEDVSWNDMLTIDEVEEAGTYFVSAYCGDKNKTEFNYEAGSKYETNSIKVTISDPDEKTTISVGSGKGTDTCSGTDFVTTYKATNVKANQTIIPAIFIYDTAGENVEHIVTDGVTLGVNDGGQTIVTVSASTLTKLGEGEMKDIKGETVESCTKFTLNIGVYNNPEEGEPSVEDKAAAKCSSVIQCKHILKHHAEVDSTCAKTGCKEHWECTECGKLYLDEECTEECKEAELVILKKAHEWTDRGITKEATLSEEGTIEYRCRHCRTTRTDTYSITADIDTSSLSKSDITQGLKEANITSVKQIKEALTASSTAQEGFENAETKTVEAELLISTDNGRNYEEATSTNTPEEGVLVTIPYPAGANDSNNFVITHMFDTDVYDAYGTLIHHAGDIETITDITKTEDGLQFRLTSASPIQIAFVDAAGLQSLKGLLTGYSGTSAVKFELTSALDTTKKYLFSSTSGDFNFKGLAKGDYKLKVSAGSQYVDHEYDVQVLDDGDENIQDVILCQLGDANCDGVLSAEDVTRIARHLAKISIEEDDYTLKLFNTTRSGGEASANDVTHLARYLAKIINEL